MKGICGRYPTRHHPCPRFWHAEAWSASPILQLVLSRQQQEHLGPLLLVPADAGIHPPPTKVSSPRICHRTSHEMNAPCGKTTHFGRPYLYPACSNKLELTLKPNLFSARAPTRGAAHAAIAPSKHRSKAKMRLRMWGGTISAKAGLLQAGAAHVPRLFMATRAHAYMATVPGLSFSGRPCTQPRGKLLFLLGVE